MSDPVAPWPLVLASTSPRRHQLLSLAGYEFTRVDPGVDETSAGNESAADVVQRLALDKALAGARLRPGSYVIGADTVVVLDDDAEVVLGKPVDTDDAVTMLLRIAGRTHRVLTGVAVVVDDEPVDVSVVSSQVTMRPVQQDEAEAYAASGEPLDKAGSYALQGDGARFVTHVDGSRSNVIGLPLRHLVPILDRLGIPRRRL